MEVLHLPLISLMLSDKSVGTTRPKNKPPNNAQNCQNLKNYNLLKIANFYTGSNGFFLCMIMRSVITEIHLLT